MINRRLFFFRPRATHAEAHLEVTTIVVVVIDIYLYDYYYLTGHFELAHGPCTAGQGEFVQVLRLVETFSQQGVAAALKDALRLGAISFDAVKHLVLCRLEGRPPRLDLELYPYLPRVRVSTTSAWDYMTLLSGRAA